FKTLAVAALAAVAVNAQFDNNACTQCVYASFPSDSVCATLNTTQMSEITSAFSNNSVNPLIISSASKDPAIKSCLCHWASTAFSADGTGAAGKCITGTTPTCNSTQVEQAASQMSPFVTLLNCGASNTTTGSNSTTGTTTTGSTPATTSPAKAAANQMNIPYVISIAAIGLAALAGL
ncbi:hypothetical protein BGZ49_009065, partial [Haplosporangium sp. Z 27]